MGYGEDSDLSRKGGDPLVSIGAIDESGLG